MGIKLGLRRFVSLIYLLYHLDVNPTLRVYGK
jgi:hypothetical protein